MFAQFSNDPYPSDLTTGERETDRVRPSSDNDDASSTRTLISAVVAEVRSAAPATLALTIRSVVEGIRDAFGLDGVAVRDPHSADRPIVAASGTIESDPGFVVGNDVEGVVVEFRGAAVDAWDDATRSAVIGVSSEIYLAWTKAHAMVAQYADGLLDPVVGIPSRRAFLQRLGHHIESSSDAGAVILLDIDRFRLIDKMDGLDGDEVLRSVARVIEQSIRPGDFVARLGADRFAVFATDRVTRGDAERITARLRSAVSGRIRVADHLVPLRVSAAVSLLAHSALEADDLVSVVESALRDAKRRGGDTYTFVDQGMRDRWHHEQSTAMALRSALAHDQLRLHFQPEYDLATGRMLGCEALLRWEHPTKGLLAAGSFIEVAESAGILEHWGPWILNQACAGLKDLCQATGRTDLVMRVNVSAHQLVRERFAIDVRDALSANGVDARQLCLEITETAVISDVDAATAALFQLQDMGCGLALDDFGTGYTYAQSLLNWPIDTLKIDRQFVAQLGTSSDAGLCGVVMALAKLLGLEVVAEGVECDQQITALLELGCSRGQGFGLARPMSLETLVGASQ